MSRAIDIQYWKCGHEMRSLPLPFSRYEDCSSCRADLHVFTCCKYHDPGASNSCREDSNTESISAKIHLAKLFGVETAPTHKQMQESSTEAENAVIELRRLFGDSE